MMIRSCSSCGSQNRLPAAKLDKQARCGKCRTPLGPVGEPYPVTTRAEFDELVRESPVPILVDFWAPWCGPCRMVAPELEELARQRRGGLVVAKLNTEELPEVAGQFGIRSIPTFVLFRGGKEQSRVSGAMPAHQLEQSLGL
jgi:thioredoxin 2